MFTLALHIEPYSPTPIRDQDTIRVSGVRLFSDTPTSPDTIIEAVYVYA